MIARAPQGLTAAEAARRLTEHGRNELAREEGPSPWALLARQFQGAMIWLLLAACAVSVALGEAADALAIGAIVVLNAFVGFFQEYRAERALLALRAMSAPRARVLRDGHSVLSSRRRGGPRGPAAARGRRRRGRGWAPAGSPRPPTIEALLTGESASVEKTRDPDRRARRRWRRSTTGFSWERRWPRDGAWPRSTPPGMRTEMGRSPASSPVRSEPQTPLAAAAGNGGRTLLGLCLAIVGVISVFGLLRGHGWAEVLPLRGRAGGGGGPGGPARRRHDRARPGRAADGGAPRHRSAARVRGDPGLRDRHLHRQDRHAHDRPHGGPRPLGRGPHAAPPRRRGVLRRRAGRSAVDDVGDPTEIALLRAAADAGHPARRDRASEPHAVPRRPSTRRASGCRCSGQTASSTSKAHRRRCSAVLGRDGGRAGRERGDGGARPARPGRRGGPGRSTSARPPAPRPRRHRRPAPAEAIEASRKAREAGSGP